MLEVIQRPFPTLLARAPAHWACWEEDTRPPAWLWGRNRGGRSLQGHPLRAEHRESPHGHEAWCWADPSPALSRGREPAPLSAAGRQSAPLGDSAGRPQRVACPLEARSQGSWLFCGTMKRIPRLSWVWGVSTLCSLARRPARSVHGGHTASGHVGHRAPCCDSRAPTAILPCPRPAAPKPCKAALREP